MDVSSLSSWRSSSADDGGAVRESGRDTFEIVDGRINAKTNVIVNATVHQHQEVDTTQSVFVAGTGNQGLDPDIAVSGWKITGFEQRLEEHP